MKTENTFVKWVFFAFVLVVPLACKQIGSLSSKPSNSNSNGGATAKASPFERPLQLTEPRTSKLRQSAIHADKGSDFRSSGKRSAAGQCQPGAG